MSVSCKLSPEGIKILSGDYTSPKLVEFSTVNSKEIKMVFTKEVTLRNLNVYEAIAENIFFSQADVISAVAKNTNHNITIEEKTICGKQYNLIGLAEDNYGNTLSFQLGFVGYNENIPIVYLNEVRTEYSKPKTEFIEFLIASDGNLGGIQILLGSEGDAGTYVFPSVEVKKGEYILLHYRKLFETCIDELANDLNLSTASDSVPGVRDLWVNNTTSCIPKTEVVILKNRSNGEIIDALLIAQSTKTEWTAKTLMAQYAQEAFNTQAWTAGADVSSALCSDKTTTTRTVSRIAYQKELSDWIITKTSGATPGTVNCTEAFVE